MGRSRRRVLVVAALLVLVTRGGPASAAAADGPQTGSCAAPDAAAQGRTRVVTVPAVPGFQFVGGGRTFTSGPDGTTDIPAALAGCPFEPVTDRTTLNEGRSAVVSRWYRPTGPGPGGPLYAAFDVYQETRLAFRAADGRRIPRSALGQVLLKNSLGVLFDVNRGDVVRLPAARVVARTAPTDGNRFYVKTLNYTVERIDVNGNTLVNRSQTRFTPADESLVEIPLIYHAVTVRTKDAFLGSAVGSAVTLRHPDGRMDRFPLDDRGRAVLDLLPRGDYELQVSEAGLEEWRPLAISRSQEVELKVLSYLDIGLVVGTSAALVLIVFVFGVRLRLYTGLHLRAMPAHLRARPRSAGSRDRWRSTPAGVR